MASDSFKNIFLEDGMQWKERKVRFAALFQHLTGGDCPAEAFELALGRDEKLKKKIVVSIHQLYYILNNYYVSTSMEVDMKRGACLLQLNDAPLASALIRLLQLPQDWDIPEVQTKSLRIDISLPWKSVHFHTLAIMHLIVIELATEKWDKAIEKYVKLGTIEMCLPIACGSLGQASSFEAVRIISSLTQRNQEACERFVFGGGISKFGKFLQKDYCAKYMIGKWVKKGLTDPERLGLVPYADLGLDGEIEIIQLPNMDMIPQDLTVDILLHRIIYVMFQEAGKTIQKICTCNDRMRRLVFADTGLLDNLILWFRYPCPVEQDRSRTCFCLDAVKYLCMNPDIAAALVSEYKLLKILEQVVYTPDIERLKVYLQTLGFITFHNLQLKRKVLDSEPIMKALVQITNTFHLDLKKIALTVFRQLSESPLAERMITYGFDLFHMVMLYEYHDVSEKICCLLHQIHQNLFSRCRSKKVLLDQLEDECPKRFKFVLVAALQMKDQGNGEFKRGRYANAIEVYTIALSHCPPSKVRPCCDSLHPERFMSETCSYHMNVEKRTTDDWHSLPASLYSNRAQCYLKTSEYKKALADCDNAICRCLEDLSDANQLLTKTVWRRTNALYELGLYERALVDICFCIHKSQKNSLFRKHYDKVVLKCRDTEFFDPIRRCSYCFCGEGSKLKRCAKCEELYCSSGCQRMSWTTSHYVTCAGLTDEEREQNREKIENGNGNGSETKNEF